MAESDAALQVPEPVTGGITLQATGEHLGTKWSIVANKAPIVGSLVTGVAFAAELIWLSPLTNAQHFLLTVVTGFLSGIFLGTGTMLGRLQDAREVIEHQRSEIARMSKSRADLEEMVLKKRLSSETYGGRKG